MRNNAAYAIIGALRPRTGLCSISERRVGRALHVLEIDHDVLGATELLSHRT